MLSFLSVIIGYAALVGLFGWQGVLGIALHLAVMLVSTAKGPAVTTSRRPSIATILFFVVAMIFMALQPAAAQSSEWMAPDKKLHFGFGAAFGLAGTMATESVAYGAALGCAVGAIKEVGDKLAGGRAHADARDFVATCAGAALGATTGFVVLPNAILWRKEW
jgi:hypothetical protein